MLFKEILTALYNPYSLVVYLCEAEDSKLQLNERIRLTLETKPLRHIANEDMPHVPGSEVLSGEVANAGR